MTILWDILDVCRTATNTHAWIRFLYILLYFSFHILRTLLHSYIAASGSRQVMAYKTKNLNGNDTLAHVSDSRCMCVCAYCLRAPKSQTQCNKIYVSEFKWIDSRLRR